MKGISMGVLDIIPGVSTVKTAGTATAGALAGGIGGYVLGRFSQKKKTEQEREARKAVEEQNALLIQRLQEINLEREELALVRVSILRNIAWEDGDLKDSEKLYIIDYILKSPDIRDNMKLEAMREIDIKPVPFITFTKNFFSRFHNIELFKTNEELEGFKAILYQIGHVDGELSVEEEKFITTITERLAPAKSA